MSTEQPDPIGDRLDGILTDLEGLEQILRAALNSDSELAQVIQDDEPRFIMLVLVERLIRIARQQHDLMVVLELKWGGGQRP